MTSDQQDSRPPQSYDELRDQIEVAMLLMEVVHGDALRFEIPGRAAVANHAIECLEDALEGKFKTGQPERALDLDFESIDRSREAREEGYAAATLIGDYRPERRRPKTLLEKLRAWFA